MERCSNCGAATRPGAKFCTSCGTRLNLDQESTGPTDSSWNSASSTQETSVATPAIEDGDITTERDAVTPPPHWEETVQDPRPENGDEAPAAAWSSGSPWTAGEAEPSAEAEAQNVRGSEDSDWSSKWHSEERVDEAVGTGSSTDSTSPEDNRWA
ncbi:MAG TPA: zinc ribbon domain-containing protein, partial [Thermomicrobiales bacterium]|nr:zinc ribbon domain-containing protein [Thermomicrobiales bacterium]